MITLLKKEIIDTVSKEGWKLESDIATILAGQFDLQQNAVLRTKDPNELIEADIIAEDCKTGTKKLIIECKGQPENSALFLIAKKRGRKHYSPIEVNFEEEKISISENEISSILQRDYENNTAFEEKIKEKYLFQTNQGGFFQGKGKNKTITWSQSGKIKGISPFHYGLDQLIKALDACIFDDYQDWKKNNATIPETVLAAQAKSHVPKIINYFPILVTNCPICVILFDNTPSKNHRTWKVASALYEHYLGGYSLSTSDFEWENPHLDDKKRFPYVFVLDKNYLDDFIKNVVPKRLGPPIEVNNPWAEEIENKLTK